MIGKSRFDYIQIRLSIAGLRSVGPLSVVYLGVSLFRGKFLWSPWIGLYAIVEASFLFFFYLPRRTLLQKAAAHPPPLSRTERQALFERCTSCLSNDSYPAGWFTSSELTRENVTDWILWSLFSCDADGAEEEWNEEIEFYIQAIERRLGGKLGNGRNKTKSMRLTFDPVVMVHRPFVWYMIVAAVDCWTSLSLYTAGFSHYAPTRWFQVFPPRPFSLLSQPSADPNLPYWYRPHRSETRLPVVFLHGIGIGLWPYIPFLKEMITQDPDVGIVAIEFLPISMRITGPPRGRSETCTAITRILGSLNISRFVLVSHSYGTVVTAHMLHSPDLAPRIAATVFIDPIPFLLHLPNVAFNFVYRKPREANEWQLWFFASRDADVSRTLSRHFFWSENVMWKEELEGRKTAIVISGSDQIVHSEEVRRYLTGEEEIETHWEKDDLQVLYFQDLDHATVFDTKQRRRPVLDIIHSFVIPSNPQAVLLESV